MFRKLGYCCLQGCGSVKQDRDCDGRKNKREEVLLPPSPSSHSLPPVYSISYLNKDKKLQFYILSISARTVLEVLIQAPLFPKMLLWKISHKACCGNSSHKLCCVDFLHKPCHRSLPTRLVMEVFPLDLPWKSSH